VSQDSNAQPSESGIPPPVVILAELESQVMVADPPLADPPPDPVQLGRGVGVGLLVGLVVGAGLPVGSGLGEGEADGSGDGGGHVIECIEVSDVVTFQ